MAALFGAVVFSGRAWLIENDGSPVPFGDQWDHECGLIYAPWREGVFSWSNVLQPVNEHRIVFTHLTNLGLFLVNGYWDPRVQMVVGAGIYSVLWALIAGWAVARVSRSRRIVVLVLLGLGAMLPLAWENTLWGFQSQFYWLMLLAWGALWGWSARGGMGRRIVGSLCLLAGPFAMASGVLAALAVIAIRVLGAIARKRWTMADGCAVLVAVAAMGLSAIFWTRVPYHDVLHARTWGEFSLVVFRLLSWPWTGNFLVGLLLWLPWAMLVFSLLTGRKAVTERALVIVALGGWALAQILAMAWGRGAVMLVEQPLSKYLDVLVWGLVVNGCALMIPGSGGQKTKRMRSVYLGGWLAVVFSGTMVLAWNAIEVDLAGHRLQTAEQLERVSSFLKSDDFSSLDGKTYWQIPYPLPEVLADRLRRARAAGILSPELQGAEYPFAQMRGISRIPSLKIGLGADLPAWRNPEGRKGKWIWQSAEFHLSGGTWLWKTCAYGPAGPVGMEVVAVDEITKKETVIELHTQGIGGWQQWQMPLPEGLYRFRVSDWREQGLVAWVAPYRPGLLTRVSEWVSGYASLWGTLALAGLAMVLASQSTKIRRKRPSLS
ncbi:MAG: hypothetical protein WC205_19780 [Opitutaceae bacterium]|jgi:hypothetical protein